MAKDALNEAGGRRGRLPEAEREDRRAQVLAAASAELVERGYDKSTMLSIARRAGASKETLYSWFGNKDGLFAELIATNADVAAERIRAALDGDDDLRTTLVAFSRGLLGLLSSPESIALNRSAMNTETLAADLLASGRHRVGPLVEAYLAKVSASGELRVDDPADAFTLLYGLVIRDTQIRVLLGEPVLPADEMAARAASAVEIFIGLHQRG